MGNCLVSSNSKVSSAQDHENHEFDSNQAEEVQHTAVTPMRSNKKKRTVRFNLQEDGDQDDDGREAKNNIAGDDSKSEGVVRIRLVVTQEELKQLLNYKNDSISNGSSLEQLLSAFKSRSGSRVSAGSSEESWRPVLESIPEDQN